MKKKIFLMLAMAIVLVCVFALSISAATFKSDYTSKTTIFYDTDGVTVLMPDWANLDDRDATAVVKMADGTFVRLPAYYVFKANSNNQFMSNGSNFDFGWVSQQLGEELTLASLVAFEIPHGTKSISGAVTQSTFSSLEELVIPTSITSLGGSMFRNNGVIRKVFVKQELDADGKVIGVTTIPGWFADITDNSITSRLEAFDFQLDYVTSIGNQAFQKSALKSFTVTAPITSIGNAAFDNCKSLVTVNINNTEGIIGPVNTLFQNCTRIESITLNGISIGSYFLQNANGLEGGGLTLVATNLSSISNEAFKNASNLTSVDISGPIVSIGSSVFMGCTNIADVKIVNSLDTPATCGNNLCDGRTSLRSVYMHGISVGGYSFRNVNGEDMVVTLTNVGYIGEGAFYKAGNITELYIEGPFAYIGASTYRECPKLKKLTVINTGDTRVTAGNGESNPVLEELYISGNIDIKGTPVFQNNVSLKHVYVGTGVTELGTNAFYKCYALETMYLADTVAIIGDRAIDMENVKNQTSESFMFVDENGNMDNTLPEALTYIGGHFLKCIKIANTQLIFPKSFTNHTSSQNYDFENTSYPEGFSLVYLGKMTAINLHYLYQHNGSRELTVYLTQNSAADIKNYRVSANVASDGTISHGAYAGVNPEGTLEIIVDDRLHNNIKATEYIKFYFCGTDEVCFVTRVNILWGENTSSSWGNFVSTPVTYAQLEAAYTAAGKTAPAKHPMVTAPEYSDATCTVDGGVKTFCLGCGAVASIEKTSDAIGHNYDYINNENASLVSIEYKSYTAAGIKTVACANCGEHGELSSAALFEDKGLSAKIFGNSAGIIQSYRIDLEAIKEYKLVSDGFDFGVLACVNLENGGEFVPDLENGKVVVPSFDTAVNSYIDIKTVGLSGAQLDKKIVLCIYVKDNGVMSFIEDGETKSSVVGTSYSQLK